MQLLDEINFGSIRETLKIAIILRHIFFLIKVVTKLINKYWILFVITYPTGICLKMLQKFCERKTKRRFIPKDTKHSCCIFCWPKTGFYWVMHASCLLSTAESFYMTCVMGCQEKSCISYIKIITLPKKCLFRLIPQKWEYS